MICEAIGQFFLEQPYGIKKTATISQKKEIAAV